MHFMWMAVKSLIKKTDILVTIGILARTFSDNKILSENQALSGRPCRFIGKFTAYFCCLILAGKHIDVLFSILKRFDNTL